MKKFFFTFQVNVRIDPRRNERRRAPGVHPDDQGLERKRLFRTKLLSLRSPQKRGTSAGKR